MTAEGGTWKTVSGGFFCGTLFRIENILDGNGLIQQFSGVHAAMVECSDFD